MKTVAFELKGKFAFFKKPDVNSKIYFTYSHIHKIALLGLLGSILGYGGYAQQAESIARDGDHDDNQYPEYYRKLKELSVSIVPHGECGYFAKKIQSFNNSVGYASREEGGNLIVREQWLEHPHWTIYLFCTEQMDRLVFDQLERSLLGREAVFIPCLGKNDHMASIENPRLCESSLADEVQGIDSLFYEEPGIAYDDFADPPDDEPFYYFEEMMPYRLDPKLNDYKFRTVCLTNKIIESIPEKIRLFDAERRTLALL